MRLSNTSKLFIVASAMFASGLMAAQDATAASDRLFGLGRESGGDPGTTLLADLEVDTPFAPTVIGMTSEAFFSGIDFQPGTGTLYVSSGASGTANGTADATSLFTMDPTTGVPTLVNPGGPGFGVVIQDIAFDAAGVLYGNENEQLYTIDLTTGVAAALGGPFHGGTFVNQRMNALAVDPTTDTLYGVSWDDGELFSIDTTVGSATLGVATSLGFFSTLETAIGTTDLSGLAFDSAGALYVSTGSQVGDIYALDITDLTVATLLGNAGLGSVSGLAFQPAAAGGPLADFNGDTDVDGGDFLALQRSGFAAADFANFEAEYGTGVPATVAVSAVPEPSALALLMLGALGLGALRTRKS